MSVSTHDIASHLLLSPTVPPVVATANQTGVAVDLLAGGGSGFAVLCVGAVQPGTTVGGKVQESDGGPAWTDLPGKSFPDSTSANAVHAITFHRTKRYVRCLVTVTGTSPQAAVCAAVGQQMKSI